MTFVFLAIGLVLIVEGLVYALAPHLIEDLLKALRRLSFDQRRIIGLVCLASGLLLVWISQV